MSVSVVNLAQKFAAFTECYSPKIAGELNDTYIKVVKFHGDFMWHHHDNEDELFLVVKGLMKIKVRDELGERELQVRPGELIIIPRGMDHFPSTEEETHVMLIEPKTTLNTGNVRNERTLDRLGKV